MFQTSAQEYLENVTGVLVFQQPKSAFNCERKLLTDN